MKKILFIMILATIFIPISQTGASMGDMKDVSYKLKANKAQIIVKQESNNELNSKSLLTSEKIKKKARISKASLRKKRITKKRISEERRDRLFGLLLLAHGGQR